MVIIFLGIWILLGLVVFFAAMRRGSAREAAAAGGSRVGQSVVTVGVVLMVAFGLAVPALVLAFNGAHKSSVAVGGVILNKREIKGRELFAHSCAICHSLAAVKSYARTGPNLDYLLGHDVPTTAARKALVEGAIMAGFAAGDGQMPALLYQGREAEDVADFVAAVAGH